MLNKKSNPDSAWSARRFFLLLMSCAVLVLPSLTYAGSYDDFFHAVKVDDASTVSSLLQRGFDPNTVEAERGDSGLILALRENAMKVFPLLLNANGADLDLKVNNGDTALMIAAYKANREAVQALLEKGAAVNKEGWTPLHYAAAAGDNEIVQMLLDKSALLDALSPNKTTPIMMAARNGHIYTVKLLLDAGADASLKNDQGMTAIDFARKNGSTDIVEGLTYRLKKAGKL
jgi:ankyrin repeat protein